MKKSSLYCILFFLLSSCASLLENIEMKNPKLSCVKKEGENEYSVFNIKFKKKSETISFVPSESYCLENKDLSGFVGVFETNDIVSRTKENSQSGKTSFLKFMILNTKNLEKKYKTTTELNKVVVGTINNRILEMRNNKDSRYIKLENKSGELHHKNKVICQDLFQSVQDFKPANLPKSEKYLVMNSFYKSCAISELEIFIDMALSVRANKEDIKNFDSDYLKKYIVNIEQSLVDKESQKNLHSIIAD